MKIRIAIITLSLLLVGTNIFWLCTTIDSAVTRTYMNQELYELNGSKTQAVGMLKISLMGKTKDEVQSMAAKFTDLEPYEKEGCLWVGWYGFKFSESGLFIDIETGKAHTDRPVCDVNL
ncbi:hypothetical protein OU997_16145 [Pseudomonas sp. SL4(2022)]|uniref:hypothetical protein n=1 Tax=Pseudomonas sp. SL4(2022) TaxID=2994661 RepID=UPI00226F3EE6|nr:hypothetical protein [Pseudomonas sp. SL4(2022)]WAC43766.1 hypothetical protein OU997_16145 [Pseudomonas sp. SL4(2022)]